MKKLSFLIALAIIISVGGVYASWNYAELTMTAHNHTVNSLATFDLNTNIEAGTVSFADSLVLKVDDVTGNHNPGWTAGIDDADKGRIVMTFTPNSGASDTYLKYTITMTNNTFDIDGGGAEPEVPIFTTTANVATGTEEITAAHAGAKTILVGYITHTAGSSTTSHAILASEIEDILTVNQTITLPTLTDFNNYSTALNNVKLTLTVEEVASIP